MPLCWIVALAFSLYGSSYLGSNRKNRYIRGLMQIKVLKSAGIEDAVAVTVTKAGHDSFERKILGVMLMTQGCSIKQNLVIFYDSLSGNRWKDIADSDSG